MLSLRNPLTLHILSEILVVTCLVMWMSGYRKRTTNQLEKLLLRIEEQDEKIQKLEQSLQQQQQQQLAMSNLVSNSPITKLFSKPPPVPLSKPVVQPVVQPVAQPVVQPDAQPVVQPVVEVESEKELDELLQAELAELNESSVIPVEELSTDLGESLKKNSL